MTDKRCSFGFAPNAMLDYETRCTLPDGHYDEHKLERVATSEEKDKVIQGLLERLEAFERRWGCRKCGDPVEFDTRQCADCGTTSLEGAGISRPVDANGSAVEKQNG